MRNFFIILILFALGSGCKKDRNNPTPSPIIVTPTSWLSAKIGENFIFIADTIVPNPGSYPAHRQKQLFANK